MELTTVGSVEELLRCLRSASSTGLLRRLCPWVDPRREAEMCSSPGSSAGRAELLARFGTTYEVGTALDVSLEDASVDMVISNNVFEHVPPPVIAEILQESRRVGGADVVVSHHIDLRDHYAKFDRRINSSTCCGSRAGNGAS
ncbi:MAG TPA: class I SAM-dependent methyltransferase [Gaiellales bacterium]|nr:class I SAM-dependent methyltransferase [Gaiellales bacterium]